MDTAGKLLFQNHPGSEVVAVVGCCGKTTFVNQLAQEFSQNKVLISPTTKIHSMIELGDGCQTTLDGVEHYKPQKGIQCLGVGVPGLQKLSALPEGLLADLVGEYDISLLEADGSRGLPCKGWLDSEPVIPPYTTHTVGIVTFLGLDQLVSPDTVLRIPEFTALTGLQPGDAITLDGLTKMVEGMFVKAVGKRCLFVNQVETATQENLAKDWLTALKLQKTHGFALLAYGSAWNNTWKEV